MSLDMNTIIDQLLCDWQHWKIKNLPFQSFQGNVESQIVLANFLTHKNGSSKLDRLNMF